MIDAARKNQHPGVEPARDAAADDPAAAADPTSAEVTPSDGELVQQAATGDGQAFATLYRRYAPLVLVRLRRILGSSDAAEDVLQEVFIQVHRRLDHYDPSRPFGAWLQGFAYNLATRHLRGLRRRWWLGWLGDDTPRHADRRALSPEQCAIDRDLAGQLYRAMEVLSPKARVAYALYELEGLGVTEIGKLTESTPQAVWGRIERSRRRVATELGRSLGDTGLADIAPVAREEAKP